MDKLKSKHTLFKGHYWNSGKGFQYIKTFGNLTKIKGIIEFSKVRYGLSKEDRWYYFLNYRLHKWDCGKWKDYEITEKEFKNNLVDLNLIVDIPEYSTPLIVGAIR